MTEHAVPTQVVETDSALEKSAESASLELYHHRWHWTLDQTNPDRVSYTAYAEAVGRGLSTIRMQALGYASWLEDKESSLNEQVQRVNMSAETAEVVDVVAKIYNVSFGSVRVGRYAEVVNDIRDAVRHKMEEKGCNFTEALAEVAEFHAKAHLQRTNERIKLRANHGIRFVTAENELTKARNSVFKALQEAREVDWSDNERQVLGESVRRLSSLLNMVDMAITGTVKVDWDAELAKLGVA